ncbi:MAG: phosphoribosylformylglycinamidine synthase subunit PurL [Bdellovibrionales bacterium]
MEVLDLNAKLKKYRLRPEELERIRKLLGREPQGVEWALFSALWSEHCSYKSSKIHLKKFQWNHPRLLTAEGENAGVIDLGEGERIAFKMESHNHPSFIEPFHGAATGVGGILRDIFTMGARPIALANYLCFGNPEAPRMKRLMEQVVKGISYYGNCVGVPTVTGATYSEPDYNSNILVNALALGLFDRDLPITVSKAQGIGNWVVYVGAKTGSDGVHGASMASESFDQEMDSKRPTVQIGDPFYEKLLIEACLEILEKKWVVAMQDMGAAGLTSSSFEMATRGGVGFKLHLDRVPLRQAHLGPEEILLSESQERMLLICEPKNLENLQNVFHRWGLEATVIGEVVETPRIQLLWRNEVLTDIDPRLIVDEAPRYERPYESLRLKNFDPVRKTFETLEKKPRDSKKWIYRQYDQRVGLRTERGAGHPVSLLRLESGRALGLALGCRPWLMKLDPVLGAYDAAMEPALKLVAAGCWPVGMTDCLNFGNPEKKQIISEFVASVEALAHSAKLWDAPVISGNVSFYNETEGHNIISTPAVGVVGLRSRDFPKLLDEFAGSGNFVSLVTLQSWQDEFKPEALVQKARRLLELFQKGEVLSARLVTEEGFESCLDLMSAGGFELNLQNLPNLPRGLYQMVVESRVEDFAKGTELSVTRVGVTQKRSKISSETSRDEVFRQEWGVL